MVVARPRPGSRSRACRLKGPEVTRPRSAAPLGARRRFRCPLKGTGGAARAHVEQHGGGTAGSRRPALSWGRGVAPKRAGCVESLQVQRAGGCAGRVEASGFVLLGRCCAAGVCAACEASAARSPPGDRCPSGTSEQPDTCLCPEMSFCRPTELLWTPPRARSGSHHHSPTCKSLGPSIVIGKWNQGEVEVSKIT